MGCVNSVSISSGPRKQDETSAGVAHIHGIFDDYKIDDIRTDNHPPSFESIKHLDIPFDVVW